MATEQERNLEINNQIVNYSKAFNEALTAAGKVYSLPELTTFCQDNGLLTERKPDIQEINRRFIMSFTEQEAATDGNQEAAIARLENLCNEMPCPFVKTWKDFVTAVQTFDPSKDFTSSLFGRRFPVGTISYIGARPGRGKTTALVNLSIDAINQGKKVVFITAEETTKQLLTRFILSTAYRGTNYGPERPREGLYQYVKATGRELALGDLNNAFYDTGLNTVQAWIERKQLVIFEAYRASYEDLINYLERQPAGAVVIIDYIQHLKAPAALVTQTRQIQLQNTSQTLANLAGEKGFITIAGAQFKRESQSGKTNDNTPDTITESSFREAGDLEQDGHILIGLGRIPHTESGTERYCFTCMKDREAAPDNGKEWLLKHRFEYSYYERDINPDTNCPIQYTPETWQTEKGKQKDKTEQPATLRAFITGVKNG